MSNQANKAGSYELESVYIEDFNQTKKLDIKLLTNAFNIKESMADGFISGTMVIFDGVGLYSDFPLKGEETIHITLKDFDGNIFNHKFSVFGIDDLRPVGPNNDHMLQYTIHFVSTHALMNESNIIRKAYRNAHLDQYALDIYNEYILDISGKKPIELDQTDNQLNLIIPAYNPIEAIRFLARKSYSNQFMTSTFRFYETKSGFHFRCLESIFKQYKDDPTMAKELTYSMSHDSTPQGQLNLRKSIINFDLGTLANTMRDIKTGAYHREVLELDHDNKQVISTIYKHHDEFNNYQYAEPMKDYHTDNINQITKTPQTILVNKNWTSSYDPNTQYKLGTTMTTDILTRKHTAYEIYHQHHIKVKIYGDLTLEAGNMININIPTFVAKTNESRSYDNIHNGLYVIETINNIFKDDEFYQELVLARMGNK